MIAKVLVAVFFVGLNYYAYHNFAKNDIVPERQQFESFPDEIGDWRCEQRQSMDDDIIGNLGVTDYIVCAFERAGTNDWVDFYAGYHERQERSDSGKTTLIHPPEHCLPGSGWDIIDNRDVMVDIEGMPTRPGQVKRLVIARGEARQLTYYWYQSRGRVLSVDWKKVLYVGLDRARLGRTDGSLVRFTIPIYQGQDQRAEAIFEDLAPRILAQISDYVPE